MSAGVLILAIIFGAITVWQFMSNRHKERMAQLRGGGGKSEPPKALVARSEDFEKRLQHLESIVTDVDFELNAKLNRLAAQTQALALPAGIAGRASRPVGTPGVLQAGQRLADRFVIERPLGSGGMGAVYLARDERLSEAVALKIVHGVALLDPSAADRLRTEASAARRIAHPAVVRIHDVGEESGFLFLSMEYVQGTSLRDMIRRHGKLGLEQLRPIVSQLLEGLIAAHAEGVIHRDLKPANILVDGLRVKIIDFGLAQLPNIEGMTRTGMILGTPEYMAPEQVTSRNYDARTDLYALGALIYHALVGHPPFVGETPIAVSLAQSTQLPTPLKEHRPDLPADWDAFVMKALEKDPSRRHASAREMLDALPG